MNINDLEFENIGSWPAMYRVATIVIVCVLLMGGFFYYITLSQLESLSVMEKKEITLKRNFTTKAALSSNLEIYQAQLVEINLIYEGLLEKLPSKKEVAKLLDDISFVGEHHGLQFKAINWGIPKDAGMTIEVPISLKVVGSYAKLGAFADDIAALPRIVILDDMRLTKDISSELVLNVIAKTYRFKGDGK
ncbi:MAG: type 4a pilus biogenesis protein PilO [Psychromonas sp.]|nr:type 4a pilus biogenesis protein PilO [Psychromonas sp.]